MEKFQLFGKLKLWEEVHTNGHSLHEEICEEFEAVDVESAIKKAKRVFNRIAKEYPIDNSRPFDHRVTNLHSFEADLRITKSVWQKKI